MRLTKGRLYRFKVDEPLKRSTTFAALYDGPSEWSASHKFSLVAATTGDWVRSMVWSLDLLDGLEEIQPADLLLFVNAPQKTPLYGKLLKKGTEHEDRRAVPHRIRLARQPQGPLLLRRPDTGHLPHGAPVQGPRKGRQTHQGA